MACGIEIEGVAVEEMRVDQCGEKVVRGGDGVEVAVKVEIDLLCRFYLRAATARGSALHAEDRTERRLARGDDGFFADLFETLHKADRGDSLAFARDGRRSRGDKDEFAANRKRSIREEIEFELRAVRAQGVRRIFSGRLSFLTMASMGRRSLFIGFRVRDRRSRWRLRDWRCRW